MVKIRVISGEATLNVMGVFGATLLVVRAGDTFEVRSEARIDHNMRLVRGAS